MLVPGSGVTSLTAGDEFTCASSDVLTWCWGLGGSGRLGNGWLGYSRVPVPVLFDRIFGNGFEAPEF